MNLAITDDRIVYYSEPTDLRKSFDGLEAIVRRRSKAPRFNRGFMFYNRRRTAAKLLLYDANGVPAILYYRTDNGGLIFRHAPSASNTHAASAIKAGRHSS